MYSDEAYEAITFDGARHASIASVPGMAERTIIASAVSKTYSWTGGRVGWAVFPTLEEALVQRNLNINYYASIPPYSQLGAKVALESPESPPAIAAMVEAFQRRRDFVIDGLNRIPGVRCQMPRGAFYAFPNIAGVVEGLGAEAAWRGAFLAHGSLTEPGRSSSLEVSCPGPEAALALVGAARRLGIASKAREVRGIDRVVIRDGDAISAMLTRMGAHESVMAWEERRMRREVRATANRLANFDDANLRRSARAAVAAGARVERALLVLGDTVPDHLAVAGQLRLQHKQASLEELGALADPPMTKDAIAGRIRRLLALADKRAIELGIPNTEDGISPE